MRSGRGVREREGQGMRKGKREGGRGEGLGELWWMGGNGLGGEVEGFEKDGRGR